MAETTAFDKAVKPLLKLALPQTAELVVKHRAKASLRARIDELADKSTEGEWTAEEKDEYAGYVCANKFADLLKRHARQLAA
jgi:hypothetical protein